MQDAPVNGEVVINTARRLLRATCIEFYPLCKPTLLHHDATSYLRHCS
jgi:hypothetical protein